MDWICGSGPDLRIFNKFDGAQLHNIHDIRIVYFHNREGALGAILFLKDALELHPNCTRKGFFLNLCLPGAKCLLVIVTPGLAHTKGALRCLWTKCGINLALFGVKTAYRPAKLQPVNRLYFQFGVVGQLFLFQYSHTPH